MINIQGIDKAKLVAALYNRSQPLGFGFYVPESNLSMTQATAQTYLDNGQTYFDYLRGRVMKIDVSGDEIDAILYDRDNGLGAAREVVDAIRLEALTARHSTATEELDQAISAADVDSFSSFADVFTQMSVFKKINQEQRDAASLYWTQILTGELNPRPLMMSQQGRLPFMAGMATMHRLGYLEKLNAENPDWSLKFMANLDLLLQDADETVELQLEYHPQGLLQQAADRAGIPYGLFPVGKLTMFFDSHGHIIVGDEIIDAEQFIHRSTQSMTNA